MGFEDFATSMQMRDLITKLVGNALDTQRPKYRYGVVVSNDWTNSKATVTLNGDTNPVIVNIGRIGSGSPGQYVRVDGIGTDKFIADVIGSGASVLPTGADANDYKTAGMFVQIENTGTTTALHFPIGGHAGILEVLPQTRPTAGGVTWVTQKFTTYRGASSINSSGNRTFVRGWSSNADNIGTGGWSDWRSDDSVLVANDSALATLLTNRPVVSPNAPLWIAKVDQAGRLKVSTDGVLWQETKPSPVPYKNNPFAGTWADYPGGGYVFHRGAYMKTSLGIVCLTGLIAGGAAGPSSTIMNLPVGYRPDAPILWEVYSNGGVVRLDILPNGDVIYAGASTGFVSLAGIMFPAAGVATWTNITFASGWADYNTINASYPACSYWRDPLGRVWQRGLARQTTPATLAADSKMYSLPFTKNLQSHFPTLCYNGVFGCAHIAPVSGASDVVAKSGTNTTWVSLSPLTFPDSTIADNWQIQSAYVNAWIKYANALFPPSRYMLFADGIVFKDGLTSTGGFGAPTVGMAQGAPDGLSPDLTPWVNDSMGGSELFLVASNLASGRLDVQRSGAIETANGAAAVWLHQAGSATWYSYGGVNYVMGS